MLVAGQVEVIDGASDAVERTAAAPEPPHSPSWEPALESPRSPSREPMPASRERFRAAPPGVVAFRVHVPSVGAMFRPSQDIGAGRYARVRADGTARTPRLADSTDE
ncbi:hypothetical protein [Nonomuraea sp. NPDC049309]|uniref:hypothetical protein n=1 Tax=Nonomuraea sp. NPDC049309 TaxID=3364350 RepID=UPI0037198080